MGTRLWPCDRHAYVGTGGSRVFRGGFERAALGVQENGHGRTGRSRQSGRCLPSGLLECLEKDALVRCLKTRTIAGILELDEILRLREHRSLGKAVKALRESHFDVICLACHSECPVPVVMVLLVDKEKRKPHVAVGSGSAVTLSDAVAAALFEAWIVRVRHASARGQTSAHSPQRSIVPFLAVLLERLPSQAATLVAADSYSDLEWSAETLRLLARDLEREPVAVELPRVSPFRVVRVLTPSLLRYGEVFGEKDGRRYPNGNESHEETFDQEAEPRDHGMPDSEAR